MRLHRVSRMIRAPIYLAGDHGYTASIEPAWHRWGRCAVRSWTVRLAARHPAVAAYVPLDERTVEIHHAPTLRAARAIVAAWNP